MPSKSKQRKASLKRLQNAYKVLIKEKAHEAITATEIAKRANLNRSTFYMYFKDRDDIFVSFHQKLIDTLAGHLLQKRSYSVQNLLNKWPIALNLLALTGGLMKCSSCITKHT